MKVFGREPALIIAWLTAIGMLVAGLNISWLNAGQTTAIVAALGAILIVMTTRPIGPGLFTMASAAVFAVFAEYGLTVSEGVVAAVGGVIVATFALFGIRPQATPAADPRAIDGQTVAGSGHPVK